MRKGHNRSEEVISHIARTQKQEEASREVVQQRGETCKERERKGEREAINRGRREWRVERDRARARAHARESSRAARTFIPILTIVVLGTLPVSAHMSTLTTTFTLKIYTCERKGQAGVCVFMYVCARICACL